MPIKKFYKDGELINGDFIASNGGEAVQVPFQNLFIWDDATIASYGIEKVEEPDPVIVPAVISDRQFFQQLALDNFITQQEALDAVQTGAIPSVMEGFVNSINDPVTQFNVRMVLSGATEFQRNHPLVDAISGYIGFDSAWIDDFFTRASQL